MRAQYCYDVQYIFVGLWKCFMEISVHTCANDSNFSGKPIFLTTQLFLDKLRDSYPMSSFLLLLSNPGLFCIENISGGKDNEEMEMIDNG